MGRVCPRCGRAIPRDARHVCPLATPPSRDRARERERRSKESWRQGYGPDYQKARNAALTRSHGLCEATGEVVFRRTSRGWRKVSRDFGGTHHVVPLSRGGANDPANVVVLCARAHGVAHSAECEGIVTAAALLRRIRGVLGC